MSTGLDFGKLPYRTIYWNCHDVAIRFAVLAADILSHRAIVQTLSLVFEEANLCKQIYINFAVALYVNTAGNSVEYMENSITLGQAISLGAAVTSPSGVFQALAKLYRRQCSLNDAQYPLYVARIDRVQWLRVVEQRFPQLQRLGLGIRK